MDCCDLLRFLSASAIAGAMTRADALAGSDSPLHRQSRPNHPPGRARCRIAADGRA